MPNYTMPLYDLTMLYEMSRGNEKFIERIKNLFVQTVPETVTVLHQKYAAADWPGVSDAAHKLKATIDTLHINVLRDVVRQIENDAKAQTNLEKMKSSLILITDVLEQVAKEFQNNSQCEAN